MHRLGVLAVVMIVVAAAYHVPNWDFHTKLCRTNMATNTACRSPGESVHSYTFISPHMLQDERHTFVHHKSKPTNYH